MTAKIDFPHLCVIVAIHRPDADQLTQLFASLQQQAAPLDSLIAVIADGTSGELVRQLAHTAGLPLRLSLPSDTLDAVRAFEYGLAEALAYCPADSLFALCDQDDIWHPERLAQGAARLAAQPKAMLVHSDARVVDSDGTLIAPSLFAIERRLRAPCLRDLLYRNTVTGMTVLMRRPLVELALPFPRQVGVYFYHDLWLALLAASVGEIGFIRKALVDYRQHDGNVMGIVNRRQAAIRRRLPDMNWVRREAAAYGIARYLAHSVYARLASTGTSFAPGRAAQLRPYLARIRGVGFHLLDAAGFMLRGNLGLARLAIGQGVISTGRVLWGAKRAGSEGLRESLQHFDNRLFSLAPGVLPEPLHAGTPTTRPSASLIDRRKDPRWTPVFSAHIPTLCILVPTLNPSEIFAGIATALDIGLGLAGRGHQVRFIATDLPVAAASVSLAFLRRRLTDAQMAQGAAERITLNCGVTEANMLHHKADRFVATAWWSAFVAQKLIERYDFAQSKFHYLIQDYEPNFYSWGSEFADAQASYQLRFVPIFNTSTLRSYFEAQGYPFAKPDSLTFRPSIDIDRYANGVRSETSPERRRIALYGRPEVARNMFPTAIEVLARFVQAKGLTAENVEIVSVGMAHLNVTLPSGVKIISKGKLPFEEYPKFLLGIDIGLSLMLSPHPSHPPLEMAASGVRVVTNSFATKDLSTLTKAILSAAPDADALLAALEQAWDTPAPTPEDRRIDLSPLGQSLDQMLDALSATLVQTDGHQRPPRKKIIVHIGAPKCGSTFLQRALLKNRDRLTAAGISYPHDGGGHPGNAPTLAPITAARMLADMGANHTLIYSHEDLLVDWVNARSFLAAADAVDMDVQIVAFLRPFSQLIFGTYSQVLKQSFDTFLTERQAYEGRNFEDFALHIHQRFRFELFLLSWRRQLSDTPLILDPHTDIRATFEAMLNRPDLDWNVHPHLTNLSLRVEDCEAIASAINDQTCSPEDVRALFLAAHHNSGLPDKGRSAERINMIETLFAPSSEILKDKLGYFGSNSAPAAGLGSGPIDLPASS